MHAATNAERSAYHESGHVAAALVYGSPILSVSLDPPRLLRGRLRAPEAAYLCVCFSGAASERLHLGGKIGACGDVEDYAMARAFLVLRYSLIEIGVRMDSAIVAADGPVATPWARARVPLIAAALLECGTLSGEQISDLLLFPPPLVGTGPGS
jgi:hypothetical protein